MPALALSCQCGTTRWEILETRPGTLVTCYCNGCQSYVRHQGHAETHLDRSGGTLLFQTLPDNIAVTEGAQHLAPLRMTSRGVVRWYAACCGTPVGNTMTSAALPFVGMVLPKGTEALGRCRCFAFTETARPKVRQRGMAKVGWGVLSRGLSARIAGRTASPFFAEGALPKEPRILGRAERQAAGWR